MSNTGHDLIAVLDWGLGHASRCVSVIEQLIDAGQEVTVASAGKALLFLREHFPALHFVELPAYNIRYPYSSMVVNMLLQSPKVFRVMWREHRLLRKVVAECEITRIISDGRFGCWHPNVESVWLAHQLHIQHHNALVAGTANTLYHAYVRRCFQQLWIPDHTVPPRLAGNLSEPIPGLPYQYLGPQSRFKDEVHSEHSTTKYRYLALLSGPEPQRSILEKKLRQQLIAKGEPALLVRGVPGSTQIQQQTGQLYEVDWLLGASLHEAVATSATIICRSGYSTLMDAHYWQKRLLLIPTPGQTEQEYLARYWSEQGWANWQHQAEISLV